MNIRTMSMEDYFEVHKLWTQTPGMGLRSLDDSSEGIAKFLKRNPLTNFVVIESNEIVGVILCGHDGRRGYIYHTAVKPEFRRQGIGKALVTAVLDALKAEQIHKAALVVYSTNETGNRFWESLGFQKREDLTYRNFSLNAGNE